MTVQAMAFHGTVPTGMPQAQLCTVFKGPGYFLRSARGNPEPASVKVQRAEYGAVITVYKITSQAGCCKCTNTYHGVAHLPLDCSALVEFYPFRPRVRTCAANVAAAHIL